MEGAAGPGNDQHRAQTPGVDDHQPRQVDGEDRVFQGQRRHGDGQQRTQGRAAHNGVELVYPRRGAHQVI